MLMARRGKKRGLGLEAEYWRLLESGVGTVEACKRLGISRNRLAVSVDTLAPEPLSLRPMAHLGSRRLVDRVRHRYHNRRAPFDLGRTTG
ncbi:hypothetical protein DP939_39520 [Spongiactinospora rosea]|uniref:Uncharacterized protein n=1 Tax=Spongiactinospora rosea TaxID=2248750 RepID=A0A366LL91_9ACTN|nr:hypothetical protein DP939_39520 [Spongiactinospora rosea]